VTAPLATRRPGRVRVVDDDPRDLVGCDPLFEDRARQGCPPLDVGFDAHRREHHGTHPDELVDVVECREARLHPVKFGTG
jgi:hypothetical protein